MMERRCDHATAATSAGRSLDAAALPPRKVLVADPSVRSRESLCRFLRERGIAVLEAPDIRKALSETLLWRPDVLLMDLALPPADVEKFVRILRVHPDTRAIPILFLDDGREGMRPTVAEGFGRPIGKPYPRDEILIRMRHALSGIAGPTARAATRPAPDISPVSGLRPPVSGGRAGYLGFYGMTSDPFRPGTGSDIFFPGPGHGAALRAVADAVAEGIGLCALVAGLGMGKTTVLREVLATLEREGPGTVRLLEGAFPNEVLREILRRDPAAEGGAGGGPRVLAVDEAHRLSAEAFDRLIAVAGCGSGDGPPVRVVLAGEPDLGRLLARIDPGTLRRRGLVRAEIPPLAADDGAGYVRHRIARARGSAESIFTRRALKEIARRAGGSPRLLNVVADGALAAGYARREFPVSARTVREGFPEGGPGGASSAKIGIAVAAALALGAVLYRVFLRG